MPSLLVDDALNLSVYSRLELLNVNFRIPWRLRSNIGDLVAGPLRGILLLGAICRTPFVRSVGLRVRLGLVVLLAVTQSTLLGLKVTCLLPRTLDPGTLAMIGLGLFRFRLL